MREYKILLDDDLATVYEEIAEVCNKLTEEILQDTLCKVIDIISSRVDKEDNTKAQTNYFP